jgi:hypothetical protein
MKKTIFIAAIACLTFTACKKDRTCTCTDSTVSQTSTEPGYTYTPQAATTSKTTYKKIKKKNVMAQTCVSKEDTYTYNYQDFTPTGSVTYVMTVNTKSDCELK